MKKKIQPFPLKGAPLTKCAILASPFMELNPGSNFVIRKWKYYLRQAFRLLFPLLQALNVISQDFLGRSAENLKQVDMMPFFFSARKERKKATSNSTTLFLGNMYPGKWFRGKGKKTALLLMFYVIKYWWHCFLHIFNVR